MATRKTSSTTRPKTEIETGSSPKRASRRPAAARKPRTSAAPRRSTVTVTEDQIRERAYHLYLQRNVHPGDPLADWLRAEHELAGGTSEA